MFDTILRGGTVIDGTGRPAFPADVGITGGTITAVGDLSAALGVERRLGQDDLDDLSCRRARDRHPVVQDAEHRRGGLEVGVPGEDRLALRAQVAVDARVGELALARARVGLGPRALLLHERVERVAVDA